MVFNSSTITMMHGPINIRCPKYLSDWFKKTWHPGLERIQSMFANSCSYKRMILRVSNTVSTAEVGFIYLLIHKHIYLFTVYLTMLPAVLIAVKDELGRIWKDASWPNLRYWPSICLLGLRILNSHPSQDSKWVSTKYVRISDALVNLISHNLVVISQAEYGMRRASWQCNENTYKLLWPASCDIFPSRGTTRFLTCNSVQKFFFFVIGPVANATDILQP